MAQRRSVWLITIAVVAMFVGAAGESRAVPITIPSGLLDGDLYRLAFVTSSTRDAASPVIGVYNGFVTTKANTEAALVALNTMWTAIASTTSVDARDNTSTNPNLAVGVPIYLLNDTLLATDNSDLWDASIANFFTVDQHGNTIPTVMVWTGTATDGTAAPGLEMGSGPTQVGTGDNAFLDGRWISSSSEQLGNLNRVYAISDILIAPEPATATLLLLGLVGLVAVRRHV